MKIWKSLIVFFILIFLSAGGYWVFKNYFSGRQINSLEVISQNAVFVFETNQATSTWNSIVDSPVWEILKTLPAFQQLSDQLTALDSLNGGTGEISKYLSNQQTTVSLHATGIETFDLLFTVNLNPSNAERIINEVKTRIPSGSRFQSRTYSDQEILEFYTSDNTRLWSIALIGNLAVISPSSFLVEEAIRFFVNEDQESFYQLTQSLPYDSDSPGRLLFDGKGIASLLRGIGNQRENHTIHAFEVLDGGVALNLSIEEGKLVFKGPVSYEEPVSFLPSIQSNLTAIEKVIPNQTLGVTQYNLASIFETQKINNRAFTGRATFSGEIQRRLLDNGFLDSFTGELYLLDLENSSGSDMNLALLARSTDSQQSIELLKNFNSNEQEQASDYYRGNEILYISEEEFPAHLFSGKFTGFGQTFVTSEQDIILFTNSQQGMKLLLDNIKDDHTWATSSRAPKAKEELSPTAGFSRLFLMDQIWDSWVAKTNPSWSSFLQKYGGAFTSFPWVSFKINQLQDYREATLVFPFNAESTPKIDTNEAITLQSSSRISFDSELVYGPKSILNYQDNTEDILVQDAKNVVHLVNAAGVEVYSEQLDGPIISDAFQIDYYKNGKLQLLIATPNKIYGIDRLGNSLPGYPFSVSSETITQLNLVDYSDTKDYRYFLSTAKGNLYLTDKTGEQLEGWNPLSLGSKTIGPPAHLRVPGKGDYMVALTEDGTLNLFNRRGEKQTGSGIQFGDSFNAGVVSWRNPSSRATQLVNITKNGEVVHSNFSGEISYRNQLIKTDRDSEFLLVPDQKGNDFIFISRQFNEVTVLDRNEKTLFTSRITDKGLIYQYFDFGSNRQLFAVTDTIQEFCYLYDLKGNLLTTMPIESSGTIQITYQASLGQYLIKSRSGSQLTDYQLAD